VPRIDQLISSQNESALTGINVRRKIINNAGNLIFIVYTI